MSKPAETTPRVTDLATRYINRSGISIAEFARRIGYSGAILSHYLSGRYEKMADCSRITNAILDYLEKNPLIEDSFSGTLYETGAVKILRGVFQRLLDRPQVYLVYAPPGSGKTDIARALIQEHNGQVADQQAHIFRIYCREGIKPYDLMRRVATACGTDARSDVDKIILALRREFRGKRVLLYFDEAQHLNIACFETLRELLDEEPRFSLCFTGSHELDRIFARFAGTLEQLERRITDKVTLPSLTADEASGILRSELAEVHLDAATIRQQIQMASVTVRASKQEKHYISVGRLMAAIREIREGLAAQPDMESAQSLQEAVA